MVKKAIAMSLLIREYRAELAQIGREAFSMLKDPEAVPIAHSQITKKTAVCKLSLRPFIKETSTELVKIPSKVKMLKL